MNKPEQKTELLNRIEDLWIDAASILTQEERLDAISTLANSSKAPSNRKDQSIKERIQRLMQDAETLSTPVNYESDDDLKDEISRAIAANFRRSDKNNSSEPDSILDAEHCDAPQPGIEANNVQHAAAEDDQTHPDEQAEDSARDEFDQVKAGFETVARLHPPLSDNRIPDSPEYVFSEGFTHLVRIIVQQYMDDDFETAIINSVRDEIRAYYINRSKD